MALSASSAIPLPTITAPIAPAPTISKMITPACFVPASMAG